MSGSPTKAHWSTGVSVGRRGTPDLGAAFWRRLLRSWLRAPAKLDEGQRREQALAGVRLILAITCLIAVHTEAVASSPYATIAHGVFLAYLIHSLLLLVLLRFNQLCDPALRLAVHLADMVSAALVFWLAGGSETGLLIQEVAFVFVLLAAAYRWGLQQTLATAAACIGLLLAQESSWLLIYGEAHFGRLLIQALPLGAVAYLAGYFGEKDLHARTKTSLINQVVEKAHSETGLRETMQAVLVTLLDVFKADRALLAIRPRPTGRAYLWELRQLRSTHPHAIRLSELESFQQTRYFFPAPANTFYAAREPSSRRAKRFRVVVPGGSERQPKPPYAFPDYFLAWHTFSSLLVTSFQLEEWDGRLFLFDSKSEGEAELHLLHELVSEVAPAVYSVYRLRRLRSRAGSLERARIARDLHDTVIQTLIGLEMQVAVLRRQAGSHRSHLADELAPFQASLRQEILNVRELIQRIKPVEVDGSRLLDSLGFIVDRFHRETGIRARFVSDLEGAALPPMLAHEVARILQEALVNVRKHSRAENVMVRLSAFGDVWKLIIEDDGRGFDFSGRMLQADLDAGQCGPVVIKERVRSLGGELAIESSPGRGARLEIVLPYQRVHG
jgi:signal transduction histidine kinase